MYDRHKSIIKWYEYDASKLVRNADDPNGAACRIVDNNENASVGGSSKIAVADNIDGQSPGGNPELDAEVARVMAQFTSAKQDGVDSVFAAMGT